LTQIIQLKIPTTMKAEFEKLTTPEQFNAIISTIVKINRLLNEEYFLPDLGLEFDLKLFQLIEIPDEILQSRPISEIQTRIKKIIFDELDYLKSHLEEEFDWISSCLLVHRNHTNMILIIIPYENFLFDYTHLYDSLYKLLSQSEKDPEFALKYQNEIAESFEELKLLHDRIHKIIDDLKQIKRWIKSKLTEIIEIIKSPELWKI